jgi:hypothetical protein
LEEKHAIHGFGEGDATYPISQQIIWLAILDHAFIDMGFPGFAVPISLPK